MRGFLTANKKAAEKEIQKLFIQVEKMLEQMNKEFNERAQEIEQHLPKKLQITVAIVIISYSVLFIEGFHWLRKGLVCLHARKRRTSRP